MRRPGGGGLPVKVAICTCEGGLPRDLQLPVPLVVVICTREPGRMYLVIDETSPEVLRPLMTGGLVAWFLTFMTAFRIESSIELCGFIRAGSFTEIFSERVTRIYGRE
jgi:hypothetical protein